MLSTLATSADLRAQPEPGVARRELARVAVVRQSGVQTYEELLEEFRGQVRAAVRVVSARVGDEDALREWLASYSPGVVVAVGQRAYDVVRGARSPIPVISVLALRRPAHNHDNVTLTIPTASVLAAFRIARPGTRRIGALYGPSGAALIAAARAEAQLLGIEVVAAEASSAAQAISKLRALGRSTQGLWLVPDLSILSPQVLQYALMLQFRHRLPLLGATRRHTMQGALFSLDHDPEDLGRQAALLANRLLAARTAEALPVIPIKLSVNFTTAQRIDVNSSALRQRADRIYQ